MKVFISWSGDRSEALAKTLYGWLPLVLHYVEPWLSKSDIGPGDRWGVEVAKNLEECNFGIICITNENLNAPWILFESGALAKSMQDGRVIPLLLDLEFKAISGPLAQFQAKKVELEGMKELLAGLNKAATSPIQEDRLDTLFTSLWASFQDKIQQIPSSRTSNKPSRPEGEILEELVSSIRNVEMRFRDVIEDDSAFKRRRRLKYNPMMIVEMSNRYFDGPSDPIQILLVSSFFKEELPWLYEIGLETYRSIKSGSEVDAIRARRKFLEMIEMVMKSPILEELGADRKTIHLLHDTVSFLRAGIESKEDSDISKRQRRLMKNDELES